MNSIFEFNWSTQWFSHRLFARERGNRDLNLQSSTHSTGPQETLFSRRSNYFCSSQRQWRFDATNKLTPKLDVDSAGIDVAWQPRMRFRKGTKGFGCEHIFRLHMKLQARSNHINRTPDMTSCRIHFLPHVRNRKRQLRRGFDRRCRAVSFYGGWGKSLSTHQSTAVVTARLLPRFVPQRLQESMLLQPVLSNNMHEREPVPPIAAERCPQKRVGRWNTRRHQKSFGAYFSYFFLYIERIDAAMDRARLGVATKREGLNPGSPEGAQPPNQNGVGPNYTSFGTSGLSLSRLIVSLADGEDGQHTAHLGIRAHREKGITTATVLPYSAPAEQFRNLPYKQSWN